MLINRRNFLKISSLASASLMMPKFLKAMELPQALPTQNKILVVLQLSGGNDGLNTIIPVRNDLYYKNRNGISIRREDALSLTDEASIHPSLTFFKELYDNGELAALNNVGYPDPDKSHFRSMDIWQSASSSKDFWETGWLGRYLDEACHTCAHPTQALEIDDMLSLALKGSQNKAIAVTDPKRLFNSSNEAFYKKLNDSHSHDEQVVDYLYQTLGNTISNASYILENTKVKPASSNYPTTGLGKDFKTIASLINSDINTQVYYLSVGSFDTHVNQLQTQKNLFTQINDAVKAFINDLKANGRFQDVLLVTFSEFGRRVAQNASGGTDHGTANQMFLISGGLKKKGLLNPLSNLEKLNDGDLIYTEDFRNVYATILKKWLNADDQKILSRQNTFYDFI
ncbi:MULTISPECIES: DUF1501 domain-containing protein [Elizabethkingia]|uniref:DUF1501 domain-containing protein n=1 Tax=Elizabethkingia anophelis R26 TaxID=1246994 RepID=A0ABM6MRQ6_9FLAO|nr:MULTISPECIES: DUF1501 domain-containing protein [Elizabethkingia]ATC35788.1 DUF1501 domain-containing protein [Elizabethkingia anophelis R26]ATC39427.1 DUF1501 domain-containing protein [Elizabethkingia anophelis Ag1]ATC43106.1 DUF1501 domain-containing protein [Elizabethkingia anophelis]ATC46782.1 DUF1501 domain-containing protein [Elizabethkingia anophelis]ELR79479.1 hypothetical protein D505_09893 [Elizabethkingia anophelis R26]